MAHHPVRVAFVGAGGWGATALRAAAESARLEIVGAYDLRRDVAQAAAEAYGFGVYDSLEQILADQTVRAVVLTLPPDENLPHVLRVAAAGKHCYLAKPIATCIADARAMQRACEGAGVVLMVGHNERHQPEIRAARRLLDEGRIGQPVLFEGNLSHMGGWSLPEGSWRADRSRCPVVPLMMLGVHTLDNMVYLLGPAVSAKAFHRHLAMPHDNEDVAAQIFELECGALAYVGDSYVSPATSTLRVMGTRGVLYAERGSLTLFDEQARPERIACEGPDPNVYLMEEFARAIVEGARPETDAEESMKALACVEAALISARDGCSVSVADLMAR